MPARGTTHVVVRYWSFSPIQKYTEHCEEHGVNSNGTVNTAVEYVLIIAPPILIVREVKDMYLVIQNIQYLDPMASFCSTISSTNRRPKTCQKVVDCGVEEIV